MSFFFYYVHIFVKKNHKLVSHTLFMNIKNIYIKKNYAEKSHNVFEGLKGGPFKHTKTFLTKCFFFFLFFKHLKKKAFVTNSIYFSQKYARNKKERHFSLQGLQIAAFQQSFSNVG